MKSLAFRHSFNHGSTLLCSYSNYRYCDTWNETGLRPHSTFVAQVRSEIPLMPNHCCTFSLYTNNCTRPHFTPFIASCVAFIYMSKDMSLSSIIIFSEDLLLSSFFMIVTSCFHISPSKCYSRTLPQGLYLDPHNPSFSVWISACSELSLPVVKKGSCLNLFGNCPFPLGRLKLNKMILLYTCTHCILPAEGKVTSPDDHPSLCWLKDVSDSDNYAVAFPCCITITMSLSMR